MNHHLSIADNDGLKTFQLPLLIPVFVFCYCYIIYNIDTFYREELDSLIKGILVKERLLYIAFQSLFRLLKGLESSVPSLSGQNVAGIL